MVCRALEDTVTALTFPYVKCGRHGVFTPWPFNKSCTLADLYDPPDMVRLDMGKTPHSSGEVADIFCRI
jgi:hypothetical protein